MRTSSERGMSLIELMMAVAMASLLLTTATLVVTTMSKSKRDGEKVLDIQGGAVSAMNIVQFDGTNAGYRFAAAPFAAWVLPNVTGTEGTVLEGVTGTTGCGPAGVQPGTDIVEFREGIPDGEPVELLAGSCAGNTCTSVQIAVQRPTLDPVLGDIVLITDGIAACLGKVTAATAPSYDLRLVDQSLEDATTTAYRGCETLGYGWKLMKLYRRVRYLVCGPAAGDSTSRPALYKQVNDPTSSVDHIGLGAPALVQDGVEDLQAAWQVADPAGELTGGTCTGAGAARVCECSRTSDCGGFDSLATVNGTLDPAPTALIDNRSGYLIRGLSIGITAITAQGRNDGTQPFLRPALFDHAVGTVHSSDMRSTLSSTLVFQNVAMMVRR